MAFKRRLTAGLAALSDPDFDPLTNGREALGLPLSAGSVDEMAEPAFLERLFQWRSLVAITRVGASNTAPDDISSQQQAGLKHCSLTVV